MTCAWPISALPWSYIYELGNGVGPLSLESCPYVPVRYTIVFSSSWGKRAKTLMPRGLVVKCLSRSRNLGERCADPDATMQHEGLLVSGNKGGQDGELLTEISERLSFVCRRRGSLPCLSTLSRMHFDFRNDATVVAEMWPRENGRRC